MAVRVPERASTPSVQLVELIEVQTGSYFGEDDIQRFEDLYQRSNEEETV